MSETTTTRKTKTAREKAIEARDSVKARVTRLETQFAKVKADHDRIKGNLDDAKAELEFYAGHPLLADATETEATSPAAEPVAESTGFDPEEPVPADAGVDEPVVVKPTAKKTAAEAPAAPPEPVGDPFAF